MKRHLQRQCGQIFLFPLLLMFYLICSSFQHQRIQQTHTKRIVGRWVCKSEEVGNVVMVFYADGSGFKRIDSNQTTYKFRYGIVKDSILKIVVGTYKPEWHVIKNLTAATLSIREYPLKTNRESVSFFDTDYKRE